MPNDRPPLFTRAFHGALALLAAAAALWMAVQLLAQVWGWLVLVAVGAVAVFVIVQLRRRRRDRW